MSYDGWVDFNGTELFNLSRTVQLAEALGIDSVWTDPGSVYWIETALAGSNYDSIATAPWYDAGYPASAEFAGIIPLSFTGLDDSTRESTVSEYIGDGGNVGRARNGTLTMVVNVAIVASTDRGAEFGKRWLSRLLRGHSPTETCGGADLTYFRYAAADAPKVHRRNVKMTRAVSVTRKRSGDCSVTWLATFTLTAGDSYEYSEPVRVLTDLGSETPDGATSHGVIALTEIECPVYNYDPIYDPLHPALVASPTVPDLLPAGWGIFEGMTFDRYWARITPPEPSALLMVPRLTLTTSFAARMVRVSVWSSESTEFDQCDPLFSTVLSYLPDGVDFVVDGEQQASYTWDGFSPSVRRADSLVYSPDARPVEWVSFNDPEHLIVTLDIFSESGDPAGDSVRVDVDLIAKSD